MVKRHILRLLKPAALRERIRTSLWLAPAVATAVAFALAKMLISVDRTIPQDEKRWYLFGGHPDSAREFLSTIASAMMSFTALGFSITIVALQLASSQFSPRVVQTFLSDRLTRLSLGAFIGAFVFAMVVLQEVQIAAEGEPAFVPALPVFIAFLVVLIAVGFFVRYIHHMGHSIRAVSIIQSVATACRDTLDGFCDRAVDGNSPPDARAQQRPEDARIFLHDRPPGVVLALAEAQLVELRSAMAPRLSSSPGWGSSCRATRRSFGCGERTRSPWRICAITS